MKRCLSLAIGGVLLLASVISTAYGSEVPHKGPGLVEAPLITQTLQQVGLASVWNDGDEFHVEIDGAGSWQVVDAYVFVGTDPVPATQKGSLVPGLFNYKKEGILAPSYDLELSLKDDLGFSWGIPYNPLRIQNIAVQVYMMGVDAKGKKIYEGAWAYPGESTDYVDFEGVGAGWWFTYMLSHPKRGHFHDAPVGGLLFVGETFSGKTDPTGGFDIFPDETVSFYLGSYLLGTTTAAQRVTPIDLIEQGDIDNPAVINMARLLQSLDDDGDLTKGIQITSQVIGLLETVMAANGFDAFDFYNDAQIETIITEVVALGVDDGLTMVAVTADEARDHLDKHLSSSYNRKNVSQTPDLGTSKAKLDLMPVLVPATRANNEATGSLDYYDENGNFLYSRDKVKPLVAVYADQIETGASDVFGAISRDDGNTWKRTNLSRSADLSSIILPVTGEEALGDVRKPNVVVRGNHILTAWTSHFCQGGKPLYSRDAVTDDGTSYPYYEDDIWGVGGPQLSHWYEEEGYPEVELPYSCVWAARGTIDPDTAEITWFKPERLTSGRRDAYQISITGAKNVGFAIIWQEDPDGLRPGSAAGPGHGWSGATTSHKTDIWYSSVKWSDFDKIDTQFYPNGDPEQAIDDPEWTTNRPMPLVPFKLPMRISDNDMCNADTMKVQLDENGLPVLDENGDYIPLMDEEGKHAGTHRYCYEVPDLCTGFYTFDNNQEAEKNVCIAADTATDRRLLDGDTGASRPNINFMPYTKKDGTQSAWVVVAYEETKGVGGGVPVWDDSDDTTHLEEKDKPDLGKNVIYHSFEFMSPDKVSDGTIVNLPEQDAAGNPLYLVDVDGNQVLDWEGQQQLAYENARRPRMLPQPAGQAGPSNTVLALIYKQGEEGKGRPSDIFMRRIVNPKDGQNPYAAKNLATGHQNVSTVTPTETWINPDSEPDANGDGTKVVKWVQTEANLSDDSSTNPYEDARAHRGILKGDQLFIAYTYTPNWAASRNAHDKYDLYIRRSFNGGQKWGTDPNGTGPICHTDTFKDYTGVVAEDDEEAGDKIPSYDVETCFEPGVFEPGRNMSRLKNNKESTIEPRLVGPPSTLATSPYPEDKQNTDVFYVSFGTESNVPKAHGEFDEGNEGADAIPGDLFYTLSLIHISEPTRPY